MERSRETVRRVSVCLLLAGVASGQAMGQGSLTVMEPPQYYSWELHPALNSCTADGTENDYTHDPRFMSMLRVYIDNSGANGTAADAAAASTVALMQSRIQESMTVATSSGGCGTQTVSTFAPSGFVITIQNYGSSSIVP
jgi:hypothetical protein